jgi:3-oxoadipate enol-lactonase
MLKTTVNGIQLAYERRGSGTPLVLLHGYPLDHSIWTPILPLLQADFDLLLPDLRGFGESESPAGSYGMADIAADIAGLLETLNIKKAVIAGHSMGGYVALAFARAYPERVLGLGLVASQALADAPEKKAGRTQEADHILAHGVGEVADGMAVKLTADATLQKSMHALIMHQRPQGLAGALRAMADRSDSMLLLSEADFPVVLVHGLADQLIPVERARAVQSVVKKGQLTEIEEAGHMPMMEAPQAVARALGLFLTDKK